MVLKSSHWVRTTVVPGSSSGPSFWGISSYKESPIATMGIFFAPCRLRKVRKIRAGTNPPPPIAIMTLGLNSSRIRCAESWHIWCILREISTSHRRFGAIEEGWLPGCRKCTCVPPSLVWACWRVVWGMMRDVGCGYGREGAGTMAGDKTKPGLVSLKRSQGKHKV